MNNYIEGIRIDWNLVDKNSYVRNIESLKSINELKFNNPITFFVGENGSGKSTLLEAIAESYGFNKEGGTKNYNFKTFDEASELTDALTIYKGYKKAEYNYFFRAETFFNIATMEEEYAKGSTTRESEHYHNSSHGESFLKLFKNLTDSKGIFLLDEPEAALSPQKQLSLFSLIYDAANKGSQFIRVTHSPILLAIPDSDILSFDDNLKRIKYEETSNYQITNNFIKHKDIMIKELIDEE